MIYVFKTSVKTSNEVEALKPHLDRILASEKWNFDLSDCDKILRIESDDNITLRITDLLNRYTFSCEELE